MGKFLKRSILTTIILVIMTIASGCGFPGLADSMGSTNVIRITALTTTESQVMANIIAELIEHETPYKTTIVNNLGSAPMQHQALYRHDADIQAVAYDGGELTANLLLPAIKDSKKANDTVRREVKRRWDQTYLHTYGFSNNYAFMVDGKTQRKYNLHRISDLKRVQSQLSFGVSSEWVNAPGVGYPSFQTAYGITFSKMRPMNAGLVYSSLKSGKMNVILGYSTDGRIDSYKLHLLKDDKHFFPPYNCGMLINNYLLREHPELKPILERLVGQISVHDMRKMNFQVDDELLEPATVAHEFLVKHNYFRGQE